MIFIPDAQLDLWLLEDIQGGDLTCRALDIGGQRGRMTFIHRQGGCVSALALAQRILKRLDLHIEYAVSDGEVVAAGASLLCATGQVAALHQGWKAVQNLLEWSCGVANYVYQLRQRLQRYVAHGQIACTRKIIPGTRLLSMQAVLDGGGIIHRAGCAETVLLFANHRRFYPQPQDWGAMMVRLRQQAPEKAIVVEVATPAEAETALQALPDVLQMDKFTTQQVLQLQPLAARIAPSCRLAVAGGITLDNVEAWAQTGVGLLVTSAPYHAAPADLAVVMEPADG
ncbi:ModD protein [Erwinia papayae]|uniref:Putative pyrophosphorylase ModD n=1 Tax=Erwinia papayae TaxID=206499 RepID=A0ABV3N5V7_9GAMM